MGPIPPYPHPLNKKKKYNKLTILNGAKRGEKVITIRKKKGKKCLQKNQVLRASTYPRKCSKFCPPIHSNSSMWPAKSPPLRSPHVSPPSNLRLPLYAPNSPTRTPSSPTSTIRSSLSTMLSPTPPTSSSSPNRRRSGFFS